VSRRKLSAATIEASIVLIAIGLAIVAVFAGWGIGRSTRATKTVTVGLPVAGTPAQAGDRQSTDRQHAPLGRDHPRQPAPATGRLPEDLEVNRLYRR